MRDSRHDSHCFRRLGYCLSAAAVLLAIGVAAAQDGGDRRRAGGTPLKQPAVMPQATEGQQPVATPSESPGRRPGTLKIAVARSSAGAENSTGAASQPADTRVVKVYAVKYTNAPDLAKSLSQIETNCRIVANDQANTLIVNGPADNMAKLEKLIEQLDVPPRAVKQSEIRTYRIQNRPVDQNLQNLLCETFGLSRGRGPATINATIATDAPRSLVIVSGEEEIQMKIQQLIKELDRPVPTNKPAGENMKVRIVWLMAGPKTGTLPETPADLKGVVEELDRIGMTQSRMAAQVVVQTSGNDTFELTAPVAQPEPCVLKITGSYAEWSAEKPNLNFKIGVTPAVAESSPSSSYGGGTGGTRGSAEPRPLSDLIQIKTTISVPIEHAVVLGVSPTGNTTSAFVVQVFLK